MEVAAAPAEGVTAPVARETVPITFTASGGEYFRIWIVNLLLTLITLGFYSAWAKVRRQRYFYGNTSIAGSAFEYHGQPLQILKGRLIAVAALIAYSVCTTVWPLSVFIFLPLLALAAPWVVVRSRKFQMQVTSWRNIRFHFHGTYGGAIAAFVGYAILAVITFYIMLPRFLYARVHFLLSNSSFGTQRFSFAKAPATYYKIFYVAVLLALVAVAGISVVAFAIALAYGAAGMTSDGANPALAAVFVLVLGGGFIVALLAVAANYERSFNNASFDGLRIGPHTLRCELKTKRLLYLYVTNVVGVLFTLGLFYPWALVRRLKYQLESMSVEVNGSLERFVAASDPSTSATGEELGEFFDVDFGF